MPERQSRHPDNKLINEMTEQPTPSHQGSSEGEVNRRVGKRGEERRVTDPDNREPATGSDNPEDDELKGPKTREKLQEDRNKA